MKTTTQLLAFYLAVGLGLTFAAQAGDPFAGPQADGAKAEETSAMPQPVHLSFTTDLVQDFPIAVTAKTTGERLMFTLGPKEDAAFITIEAMIVRNDDGSITITTTFNNETLFIRGDEVQMRRVGFDPLSVVLTPGDEEVLFSSGERTFVIGWPTSIN